MTIGTRIAQKRKERALSQEALGAELGVSRQSIYKWENDVSIPEIDKLIAMSRLFGVTVGWLLGVEDQENPVQQDSRDAELDETQLKMVQTIVDQYLAARPVQHKKWQRFGIALAALALVAVMLHFSRDLEQIQHNYESLQSSVYRIDESVGYQIDSITGQVETILQAQNSLVADFDLSQPEIDGADSTVTYTITVTPKTYLPGMQAQLLAESDGAAITADATLGENQTFTGRITCPLSNQINLKVNFLTGEKQEQQLLKAVSGLYDSTLPEAPSLLAEQLDGITLRDDGTVVLETDAYLPVRRKDSSTAAAAGGTAPAEIASLQVGLFCNRELVAWAEPCEQPSSYSGFEDYAFYTVPPMELPGGAGDFYVSAALICDTFGRQYITCGDAWCLDETGALEQWMWVDEDGFTALYGQNWMCAGPVEGWTLA